MDNFTATFVDNFYNILEETEKSSVTAETKFKDLEEWNSMTALMLIAMVDEEYGKKITGTHIKDNDTVGDLAQAVQNL